MINTQSLLYGFRFVIVAKNQFATACVTNTFDLCRIILNMICAATAYACTSSRHTAHNILIRHININRIIQFLANFTKCFCQSLSLRNCSRKSIQNISLFCIILSQSVNNKIYDMCRRSALRGAFCSSRRFSTL